MTRISTPSPFVLALALSAALPASAQAPAPAAASGAAEPSKSCLTARKKADKEQRSLASANESIAKDKKARESCSTKSMCALRLRNRRHAKAPGAPDENRLSRFKEDVENAWMPNGSSATWSATSNSPTTTSAKRMMCALIDESPREKPRPTAAGTLRRPTSIDHAPAGERDQQRGVRDRQRQRARQEQEGVHVGGEHQAVPRSGSRPVGIASPSPGVHDHLQQREGRAQQYGTG